MRLKNASVLDYEMLVVDSWIERGVLHGFGNRSLDITRDAPEFERRLKEQCQDEQARLLLLKQVHGKAVACGDSGLIRESSPPEADAWLGGLENTAPAPSALGIKTADCLPVLILAPSARVAALHCGWKSAVQGILPEMLRLFKQAGEDIRELEIAIGPGAQACCFEIGSDTRTQFETAISGLKTNSAQEIIRQRQAAEDSTKCFGSIRDLLLAQAYTLGVQPQQVVSSDACTICGSGCSSSYFSFRREPENPGRQLSWILKKYTVMTN